MMTSIDWNYQNARWGGGGGDTPYIRMIGMVVVFLGVVIGDLIFFRCFTDFQILSFQRLNSS